MEPKTPEPSRYRIIRFSAPGLWKLFTSAGLITHVWAFVLILQDYSWLVERSNAWGAVGVGAYGLVTALVESILVFFVLILIGFVLPKAWSEAKRLAVLAVTVWVVSLFAIANQLYFLLGKPFPMSVLQILAASEHPLWFLYGSAIGFAFSVILTLYIAILKSNKVVEWVSAAADRVSTLMALYLFIDFISLVIVIIRNIS